MDILKLNDGQLAQAMEKGKVRVSKKTLNNIRHAKHPTGIDNLEAVANQLDVPLWIMLIPNLPTQFLVNPLKDRLRAMVEHYVEFETRDRKG